MLRSHKRDPRFSRPRDFLEKLPRAGKGSRLAGRVPASRRYFALPKVTEISARDRHAFAMRSRFIRWRLPCSAKCCGRRIPTRGSRAHRSGRSLGSLAINSEHFTRGNAGHHVQLRCSTALVRPRPASLRALATPCCSRAPSSGNHARHVAWRERAKVATVWTACILSNEEMRSVDPEILKFLFLNANANVIVLFLHAVLYSYLVFYIIFSISFCYSNKF